MGDLHQTQTPGTTQPTPEEKPNEQVQPAPLTPEQTAAAEKAAADKKAVDEKAAADLKAAEFKPITVADIKLPEGVQADKPMVEGFVALVNEHKISPALQAALIDLQSKSIQALSAKDSENWNATQGQWEKDIKADKDFGGQNYDATIADVGKFMAAFGNDEVRAAFDLTGAGNHPAIIKMLATAAKMIKEGSPVLPGAPGTAQKTQADILYGDNKT
jgi:hypothetical protein